MTTMTDPYAKDLGRELAAAEEFDRYSGSFLADLAGFAVGIHRSLEPVDTEDPEKIVQHIRRSVKLAGSNEATTDQEFEELIATVLGDEPLITRLIDEMNKGE